jgi:hypothetical protein
VSAIAAQLPHLCWSTPSWKRTISQFRTFSAVENFDSSEAAHQFLQLLFLGRITRDLIAQDTAQKQVYANLTTKMREVMTAQEEKLKELVGRFTRIKILHGAEGPELPCKQTSTAEAVMYFSDLDAQVHALYPNFSYQLFSTGTLVLKLNWSMHMLICRRMKHACRWTFIFAH